MPMELETVEHVVAALVALYEGTLDDHTQWQRRVRQHNHYRTRDRGRSCQSPLPPGGAGAGGGLGTSLRYSAARIRDTFANGTDVLGPDFAAGDSEIEPPPPRAVDNHISAPVANPRAVLAVLVAQNCASASCWIT